MSPSGSLAQITSDVQLAIVAFLDPPDIISLSKTCHTLHQICSERAIWTNAFRQMCSQNKVFVPSYPPIQEMSLAELREHTLSPYKFLDLLHEENLFTGQSRLPDPVRQKITCPDDGSGGARFGEMFLIPGGRYLLSKSGDDGLLKPRIDVWDLSLDTKGSPPSVATLACDPGATWAVCPSKRDCSEFLILILMGNRFCISSFNSSFPGPKISPIASFSSNETLPIYQYVFNDPFICLADDFDVLTVSNFREDLWGSYHLDVDLHYAEIVLHGNVVTTCALDEAGRATFYGWDLSNLEPHLKYLDWKNSTEITRGATPLFVLRCQHCFSSLPAPRGFN